jgi:hypothetical protein
VSVANPTRIEKKFRVCYLHLQYLDHESAEKKSKYNSLKSHDFHGKLDFLNFGQSQNVNNEYSEILIQRKKTQSQLRKYKNKDP